MHGGIAAITGNMHGSLRAMSTSLVYHSAIIIFVRSRNCFCSWVGVRVHIFSYALARAG